jgi:hypothetical protein
MVLLNYIVEVFIGSDFCLSWQYSFDLQFSHCLMCRLITVECDFLRYLMIADRLAEEANGSRFIAMLAQSEIDCPALLIDCTIEIMPLAFDTDIGLIDSPG